MAPPTLTSVSPDIVPGNGGRLFTLTGTFELAMAYRVHVGLLGTTADAALYAGAGKGNDLVSLDGLTLQGYLPELPVGTICSTYVQERDTPANNDTLANAVRVVSSDYSTSLWSMKALFPPSRRLGARGMALLTDPAHPTNHVIYSEDYANAAWSKNNLSAIVSEEDPFGTARGVILHENALPTTTHNFGYASGGGAPWVADGRIYTASVYAKAMARGVVFFGTFGALQAFDLVNGVLGVTRKQFGTSPVLFSEIQNAAHLGVGWHRLVVTAKAPVTPTADMEACYLFLAESDTSLGYVFTGLNQDSARIAFMALDLWCVPRAYRKTTAGVIS